MKNKIGWCNTTWNPVWGCLNNCEYCYARRMAKRFAGKIAEREVDIIYGSSIDDNSLNAFYEDIKKDIGNFYPTFLHSQFDKKLPKKAQKIFIGSMSEIAYWETEWMDEIIEKIKRYPQHTFQFLTKFPKVYFERRFPKNCWLGVTITKENDFEKNDEWWGWFFNEKNNTFFSLEPLLEPISTKWLEYSNINWVIIGAETGNRKGKVIPKRSWVQEILFHYRRHGIPVYIKYNLSKYYDEYRGYQHFPTINKL